MGSLILPAAGLVYIDASSLIYSMERVEPYRTLLESIAQQWATGSHRRDQDARLYRGQPSTAR